MKNTKYNTPPHKFEEENQDLWHSFEGDEHDNKVNVLRTRSDKAAKLAMAAPDLLDALENAVNVLAGIATGDLKTVDRNSPALLKARSAIQKARGE